MMDALSGKPKKVKVTVIDLGKGGKTAKAYEKQALKAGKKTNAAQKKHTHYHNHLTPDEHDQPKR